MCFPLPLRTMLNTLLGKKVGMTQVYDEQNALVPVTIIEAGPCPVIQVKNLESDGYHAIQIGFGVLKEKRVPKALAGHLKAARANDPAVPSVAELREVRGDQPVNYKPGDTLRVGDLFKDGQLVDIIGTTKGRGFQGVMKRYSFQGGPAAHGSMFHRRGGSFGMRQTPGHIFKNKKMPGHMGDKRRTVQNLTVIKVIADRNILLVKGSIPGANGSAVIVRAAIKATATA